MSGEGWGCSGTPTRHIVPSRLSRAVKASRLWLAATVLTMRSKLLACAAISSALRETTTSSAPSAFASVALALRGGEGDGVRAHRVGELDAHMAEPANADDADLLARAGLPVAQRRIKRDAGAEQRRDRGELILGMADFQDEAGVDDDPLRIAAERVARRVRRRAVIGADKADLAILLQPLRAGRAALARIDEAADADRVADRDNPSPPRRPR